MKDWCLEHPYMTFACFIWTVTCFAGVISKITDIFKKPQPTTVNLNLPPELQKEVREVNEESSKKENFN